jgi:hypothetical protein
MRSGINPETGDAHMTSELQLIMELAEGNPGAALALGELCRVHDSVDPYMEGGVIVVLHNIHDLGLCGPNIHILFKDVCHGEAARFDMLFRAWQLGFLPEADLKAASIRPPGITLDTDALWDRVCAELPRYQSRVLVKEK